ncbi:Pre-mRNA-processing factor like, partial [Actinidia chinensis var. chinensis]
MDLLQSYADDMDDDQQLQEPLRNPSSTASDHSSPDSSPIRISLPAKSAAPKVDDTALALTVAAANRALTKPLDPTQRVVAYNPTYDQLWSPIYGPAHPYAKDGLAQGMRNHKLGFVENAAIEPFVFDEQYNTFHKFGYAADPSASEGNNYVGDLDKLKETDGISVYNIPQHEQKKRKTEKKKEREEDGDDGGDVVDGTEVENPASETWLLKNRKSPW